MVRAIDMKYKATGPLADIVGTRAMKRGQMMKKIWKEIDAADIQGVEGDTAKYKGKTYKGGQILHVGDDPDFKELCNGKKKIVFFELTSFMNDHMELVD
jgi:chromatin remodeling complex protein RSC6